MGNLFINGINYGVPDNDTVVKNINSGFKITVGNLECHITIWKKKNCYI